MDVFDNLFFFFFPFPRIITALVSTTSNNHQTQPMAQPVFYLFSSLPWISSLINSPVVHHAVGWYAPFLFFALTCRHSLHVHPPTIIRNTHRPARLSIPHGCQCQTSLSALCCRGVSLRIYRPAAVVPCLQHWQGLAKTPTQFPIAPSVQLIRTCVPHMSSLLVFCTGFVCGRTFGGWTGAAAGGEITGRKSKRRKTEEKKAKKQKSGGRDTKSFDPAKPHPRRHRDRADVSSRQPMDGVREIE